MTDVKYGADILVNGGRIGGHIIITDNSFTWKPVRFGFIGNVDSIVFSLEELEGYIKDGTTLYIGVKGFSDYFAFYTWKGQSIIDAIKNRNHLFRMYATNEYSKSSRLGCMGTIVLLTLLLSTLASMFNG